MKTLKHLFTLTLVSAVLMSCYTETVHVDSFDEPLITLDQRLQDYELWYVDINRSSGDTPIPFMQRAFTISFDQGNLYANNNISGVGSNGNGFGIDVGFWDTIGDEVDISHDIDGTYTFQVRDLSAINEIELYNASTHSRYVLVGYQRSTFDYDRLFYDNIHYLLQEFQTWEKIYTSETGSINPFDEENYLQFLPAGINGNFRSSIDPFGTVPDDVVYDYEGIYDVQDISGTNYEKTLTLDYNFPDNEFFELTVIDDRTVELYHLSSETTYRFRGRGYITFKNNQHKLRKSNVLIKKEIQALKAKKAKAKGI